MIIDVHAHSMPAEYLDRCKTLGGSYQGRFAGVPDRASLDARLAMMEEAGVVRQVLSPTCPPYSDNLEEAGTACRLINDYLADLKRNHPDRFDFWASVPLPHVDEALDELARAIDEDGAIGVILGCSCLETSIADKRFDPLYEELNRRKAIVFLHPCQNGIHSHQINEWGLTVCVGASLEDSMAALHLIAAAIPSRFPDIRFIVPHFGGILPMLLERLDGQMPKDGLAEPPGKTARRFFYDTVGWGSKAALIAAVEAFGADQLVTGSDFPVLLPWESYRQTFDHIRESELPAEMRERILTNASRLLGYEGPAR